MTLPYEGRDAMGAQAVSWADTRGEEMEPVSIPIAAHGMVLYL